MPPIQQPQLQRATLTLHGELLCRRPTWAGELVVAAFDGAARTGLSAASSLCGAASLVVDGDIPGVLTSNRDAAFDFVVNTLDEALRALKNEIRRGRPLAVALTANPQQVLDEAAGRGLAPTLFLNSTPAAPHPFQSSITLQADSIEAPTPTPELIEWLRQRNWSQYEVPWGNESERPAERSPAEMFRNDVFDDRRNWLRNLTKYQRSVRGHGISLWLTREEAQQLGLA